MPSVEQISFHDFIAASGIVAAEGLSRARAVQGESGDRLDAVLTRLGLVSERALAEALARATGLEQVAAEDFPPAPVGGELVSPRFLREVSAVPIALHEDRVSVALVDPFDGYVSQALGYAFGRPVQAMIAKAGDVDAALDRLYGAAQDDAAAVEGEADEADLERLKDLASDAPVVRAVNALISRAAELRASDIHAEPSEDGLKVRFRIDGVLQDQETLPPQVKAAFVSRVKVLANLNIAERRLPQDGRMRLAVRGHEIDLRVATSPTLYGESVVLRLLDRSNLTLEFADLGFDESILPPFLDMLARPHGIVLVTGPTGSGKTTTLYAALAALNAPTRKILTIEDPIEYRLAGVNQTQVSPTIGLTFAAALRSFLRQDPDVMMVGEIRDLETAQVAVQSALTGHTILSTLHTNSAAAAVTRLVDMGMEPFLISSTVNAVLAQRLVRRLCPACRVPHHPGVKELSALGSAARGLGSAPRLWAPKGCEACGHSGFKGRLAILELLPVDDEIARLVLARAEAREIERAAVAAGMRTMLQDGVAKALAGQTTIDEILRVTREE
ncbi:GspE/PulE family protein [Caulobacter endophyticus]|uniref:GspE/PulE family protein n=1 Tax=Caulobacter endophyticus TaxID=2172652 RepID=UPI00240FF1D7|nr:ATPase, T2SS/T4P/T4SS family [Caulobacter endophyticus]MDG2527277.1 ATPase, T2SS/T4P/T4SS family [Caulobacter endophyticus]